MVSKQRLKATFEDFAASEEVGARIYGEPLTVMRTSVAEEAGESTVMVAMVGADQAIASQLHVIGFIVTETS